MVAAQLSVGGGRRIKKHMVILGYIVGGRWVRERKRESETER